MPPAVTAADHGSALWTAVIALGRAETPPLACVRAAPARRCYGDRDGQRAVWHGRFPVAMALPCQPTRVVAAARRLGLALHRL